MSSVVRCLWVNCLAAAIAFMSAQLVNASDKLPPELEKLKASLEKYQDPVVAVRDGYFSTLGCVTFATGTMGVHFLNPALIGPEPDPMKPTLLVYEPGWRQATARRRRVADTARNGYQIEACAVRPSLRRADGGP
ncbi:hypothetical protein [Sinorhizobium fredii]|uniref:hypothetical protein n=1 Tax=Rhizobium fredii TaxID=380 RepID=UPI003519876E